MKNQLVNLGLAVMMLVLSQSGWTKEPVVNKLDTSLRQALGLLGSLQPKQAPTRLEDANGALLVSIRLNSSNDEILQTLKESGVNIVAQTHGLISALVDETNLLNVAAFDFVSRIYPVDPPHYFAVEGEQVRSLRADLAQNNLGVNGSGIKVGMLSNSFAYFSKNNPTYVNIGTEQNPNFIVRTVPDLDGDGVPELTGTDSQLSGDLPEAVELIREATPWIMNGQDISSLVYDDEGRALAEVVHEMAPGAELAYYGATAGNADFAQGLRALAEIGCKVIVDDFFSQRSAIFQEDEIRQEMRALEEEFDVVFVVSAGNFGSASVEAAYLDANPETADAPAAGFPQGNDLHNWNITLSTPFPDPFLDIILPPSSSATFFLYWEDSFSGTLGPGASTDYDLLVFSKAELSPEKLITLSANAQGTPESPAGDPIEVVQLVNNATDAVETAFLAVNLAQGPPANLKLIIVGNVRLGVQIQRDVWSTNGFMSIGHPLSPHALTIGAVNFVEHDTMGKVIDSPNQINPTYYTSRGGPVPLLFGNEGERLATPQVIYKPDLASIDGMNTSFFEGSGGDYGFDEDDLPNFLGTSAAAPAAAGVIALMRSVNPDLPAEKIISLAKMAASDIHTPGFDFYTGHGILYADDAINAVLDPPTGVFEWEFWSPTP